MAQRTIHYLLGELLSKQVELKDKKRFLLGSILPDAYIDVEQRDITHFKVRGENGIYLNFHKFLNDYQERIQENDLYLGYYMHLVEDAFYRDFFYNQYARMPKSTEDVKRLHADYHILNKYIVKKYELKNDLYKAELLYQGEFERIAGFRVESFLKELEQDFVEDISGETFYVTEEMVDEFVNRYLLLAVREVENIRRGSACLNPTDYMWLKNDRRTARVKEMETSFDFVQEMMNEGNCLRI